MIRNLRFKIFNISLLKYQKFLDLFRICVIYTILFVKFYNLGQFNNTEIKL